MGRSIPHGEKDLFRSFLELTKVSGNSIKMRVATGSMLPLIRPGDRIRLRPADVHGLRSGDIVVFHQGDKIIVHRLLKIENGRSGRVLWQKGDASSRWGCFDEGAFLGRVETLYRGDAVLQMRRFPWRSLNRLLGVAGRVNLSVIEEARQVKRRMVKDRSIALLKWLARIDAASERRLRRLLIRAALAL